MLYYKCLPHNHPNKIYLRAVDLGAYSCTCVSILSILNTDSWQRRQTLLSRRHRRHFYQMIHSLLLLGYSVMYRVVSAAEHGVASSTSKLIMIAAAPGVPFPAWPEATHVSAKNGHVDEQAQFLLPPVTVRDAIRDLQWRNPRIQAHNTPDLSIHCAIPSDGRHPQPSSYALALGAQSIGSVTHHTTWLKAHSSWKIERSVGSYDEPSGSGCYFCLGLACVHAHLPLSVIRIFSYLDET